MKTKLGFSIFPLATRSLLRTVPIAKLGNTFCDKGRTNIALSDGEATGLPFRLLYRRVLPRCWQSVSEPDVPLTDSD